jgi:hypothetical protein
VFSLVVFFYCKFSLKLFFFFPLASLNSLSKTFSFLQVIFLQLVLIRCFY